MNPSASATRPFTSDYESVFNAACWAAVQLGMAVNHADRVAGIVSLSCPASGWTWGENLGVRIWQDTPGVTEVYAQSTLKFGLIDWGKGARNIERLFGAIDAAVAEK